MATSERLIKHGTLQTLTCSQASLANGAGRISAVVDNTTIRMLGFLLFVQMKTGSVAPTNGAPYKLYLVERSNGGTDLSDDALGTTDAAVSTEPLEAECLGCINVDTTTARVWTKTFRFEGALPPKFSILPWNAIGQTVDSTAGNFILQLIPITDEQQ